MESRGIWTRRGLWKPVRASVVKGVGRDGADGWRLVSDNPDKQAWPTLPGPVDAPVVGEVKCVGRTFS